MALLLCQERKDKVQIQEIKELSDSENIYDWKNVSYIVLPKLINYEKNEELLQDIPYIKYLDFAVVFFVPASMEKRYEDSTLVDNHIIRRWQVDEQTLFEVAIRNGKQLMPAKIQYIDDVIIQMIEEREYDVFHFDEMLDYIGLNPSKRLLVLSNHKYACGAITMLYKGVLQKITNRINSSFLILPCSIDMVLIAKTDGLYEREIRGYSEMVKEINGNKELTPDMDFLSDNIYFYDKAEGKLMIV